MRSLRNVLSIFAVMSALVFGLSASADAQQRGDRQVRDIVRSLNSRIDDLRYALDDRLRSGSLDRRDADDLLRGIGNLQDKVAAFDENLSQRRENRDDVLQIVNAAKDVETFFRQGNAANGAMRSGWADVRDLIDRLASNYGVSSDRNRRTADYPAPTNDYPSAPSRGGTSNSSLTGTYQLDAGRSESVGDLVAGKNVSAEQRNDLESKLEAPDQLALDIRGNEVTLASTKTQPVSFVADGATRSEQIGGRAMQLRAAFRGPDLVISTTGGESDFTIIFSPLDGGRGLKITRRVTTEYLNETILAESFYNKTESIAGLGIDRNQTAASADDGTYSSSDPNDRANSNGRYPAVSRGRTGDFVVPNGATIVAVLDNEVNTGVSQNNDRFTMIVQSPNEFRGATIEGRLSGVGRSGQVSGRSNVTFNFESITLRSGEKYDFGGTLLSVKDQNGKDVKVDAEGTARGQSQTRETAKRGGVGAGLGAIIGAIAGGGQGAAIGAIIGGGVGAGSVVVQGRDDLRLLKGSTVTIQSSSPIRDRQPVSEN